LRFEDPSFNIFVNPQLQQFVIFFYLILWFHCVGDKA
jgi:hypothetical protein